MKLTGRAKKLFDSWLRENHPNIIQLTLGLNGEFEILEDSLKFGVLVDWADNMGYNIECFHYMNKFAMNIKQSDENGSRTLVFVDYKPTRSEARIETINKLNHILNE